MYNNFLLNIDWWLLLESKRTWYNGRRKIRSGRVLRALLQAETTRARVYEEHAGKTKRTVVEVPYKKPTENRTETFRSGHQYGWPTDSQTINSTCYEPCLLAIEPAPSSLSPLPLHHILLHLHLFLILLTLHRVV